MHVIRLRSAWQPAPPMDESRMVRFERSFGKPTNLGAERVFLAISPAPAGEVHLNGNSLPSLAPDSAGEWRQEVTSLLNLRNLLSIAVNSSSFDLDVSLEIVE